MHLCNLSLRLVSSHGRNASLFGGTWVVGGMGLIGGGKTLSKVAAKT